MLARIEGDTHENSARGETLLHDQPAAEGTGPLLQRDYTVAIDGSQITPRDVCTILRREFCSFAPQALAAFQRIGNENRMLELGDVLTVDIRGSGRAHITVIHQDECSVTMSTQSDHPEAGRITFGAYDSDGSLILRITSRARSGGPLIHLMYLVFGKRVQTQVWETFLTRLAAVCGGKAGTVQVAESRVQEKSADSDSLKVPTFSTLDTNRELS